MKYAYSAAALLLAGNAVAEQLLERDVYERDLCGAGAVNDGGNWYCQAVNAITYTGIGHSGSYNQVNSMPDNGQCGSVTKAYSGALAPFDEEVSLHFRGPLNLKQFAVYTPSGNAKRDEPVEAHHAHAAVHARNAEKRAIGDIVTATINGKEVTWANTWGGATPAADAPAAGGKYITATINGQVVSWPDPNSASQPTGAAAAAPAAPAVDAPAVNNLAYRPVPTDAPIATSPEASPNAGTGNTGSSYGSSSSGGAWTRQGYYNAASGTSQGLAFLNHFGGSGSGVFDYTYGNSLSYASADGRSGAASPQVLADTVLPSVAEVVVFTDRVCSGSDCGFVRPGSVAHHGFGGASKIFLLEFGMPDSGETTTDIYSPKNMPAIWMLNAQIPRTLQYGLAQCSCWTSGCGEFDLFEVLAPGDKRCKSTIHGNAKGGDSDYFPRPTSGTMKAAVIMHNDKFHIKVLDNSQSFDQGLSADWVNNIISSTSSNGAGVSLFGLTK